MPLFLTGDELGNIKSLQISPNSPSTIKLLNSAKSSVAALSVASTASTSKSVAAGYADGSVAAFTLQDDELESVHQWKETRFKPDQKFVGLQATEKGVYSCTSNGALRLTPTGVDNKQILGSLPARLCDWRLASDQATFAYGGDEVDLSVWDTEKALTPDASSSSDSSGTKRKRDALFAGEIWRAKNIPNDGLGLRQPVRITSLTYLSSSNHLLTGTQFGDVRRYDTRARRPVSNWKGVGNRGGIKVMEKGFAEHEVFVGDHGCDLFSLDLRNGRVIYSYKGLSGAVTSIAPSPSLLVSTALDRYSRVHTSFPPPPDAGQSQDNKGQVVEKVFMTSIPTVVVWDGAEMVSTAPQIEADDDDVWDEMENVEDDIDGELKGRKRRRNVA
ncbi:WD40-repeat-containing domain protein [Mycena epipterygia]|nr:WD40-repeat-containing domain protein [Mycena epipterygia]